jgi:thiamine biosynthesis lipoprotein
MEAWGFTTDSYQVPPQAELDRLLANMGMEHVYTEGDAARLDEGTRIDLGGIAKGYASDCLVQVFENYEVERGWASLGGNVVAWGTRPDGAPWKVGVRDPKHTEQEVLVGMIGLENAFAVTSGGYERFFEENGKTYHHILDPKTGYPADSGLVSVTVVADCETPGNGAMCDALSTALFVMGEEAALEFRRSSGYAFDLVLVTADDRVVVTDGIAEQFMFNEESEYRYEIVT